MPNVKLRFSEEGQSIRIGELNGRIESSVAESDTRSALQVVEAVMHLEHSPETPAMSVLDIAASDRDRILLSLYELSFGDIVETRVECPSCGKGFELQFSLQKLASEVYAEAESDPAGRRVLEMPDRRRFRPPTGRDELALLVSSGLETNAALLERCVLEGNPGLDPELAEEALQRFAPQLTSGLSSTCPECGHEQECQFDIQDYFLRALIAERPRFFYEVHLLSRNYHWTLTEILSLTRSSRKAYVALIEEES